MVFGGIILGLEGVYCLNTPEQLWSGLKKNYRLIYSLISRVNLRVGRGVLLEYS